MELAQLDKGESMTPQDFTYWLQGFFEISGENELTEQNIQVIKDHLELVIKELNKPKLSYGGWGTGSTGTDVIYTSSITPTVSC